MGLHICAKVTLHGRCLARANRPLTQRMFTSSAGPRYPGLSEPLLSVSATTVSAHTASPCGDDLGRTIEVAEWNFASSINRNPQPRLAHPGHRPPPPARGLGPALQHHPRADRDLRRPPPPATPAPSTGHRAGSMSEPPKAAGATTATGSFDKPKKDVWLRPLRRDWKRTLNH